MTMLRIRRSRGSGDSEDEVGGSADATSWVHQHVIEWESPTPNEAGSRVFRSNTAGQESVMGCSGRNSCLLHAALLRRGTGLWAGRGCAKTVLGKKKACVCG
jgi:hypothetical protein